MSSRTAKGYREKPCLETILKKEGRIFMSLDKDKSCEVGEGKRKPVTQIVGGRPAETLQTCGWGGDRNLDLGWICTCEAKDPRCRISKVQIIQKMP